MNNRGLGLAVLVTFMLLSFAAALRAQTINMQFVTVGNAGNAPDPATGSLYGSVSYVYDIGEYDVTDSQYCTFLNAVDPTGANALDLYSPEGDAEYGITLSAGAAAGAKYSIINGYTNMPVVDVNFWDTLRFANWMDNGEGSGSTESGAYTLLGDSPTPSNASALLASPQPNGGAAVWLPSENEWYKAAYYDPALNGGSGGYWTYATQSNNAPGNMVGNSPNQANYYNGVYSVTQSSSGGFEENLMTAVGSFTASASYYGTYDQSGDIFNLNGTVIDGQNFDYPVLRGGFWDGPNAASISSSTRFSDSPGEADSSVGFRVASLATIPEPSVYMLVAGGGVAWMLSRRKPIKQ